MKKIDSYIFRKEFENMMQTHNMDTVLILGHVNPDGDCVGSVMALAHYLAALYPEINVVPYLAEVEKSIRTIVAADKRFKNVFSSPEIDKCKNYAVIICDTATEERIVGISFYKQAKVTMLIDHHLQNGKYATVNFLEYREACAENIFSIIDWSELNGNEIKDDILAISEYIYLGIIHDTSFFNRVDKYTFEIANNLILYGVDYKKINRTMHSYTLEELIKQNSLLEKTVIKDNVAYVFLRQDECASNHYTYYDLHKLPDVLRDCEGVEIAFVLFEEVEGLYKCSMRSKEINVNEILKQFGGGGHKNAASFKMTTTEPDILLSKLLTVIGI